MSSTRVLLGLVSTSGPSEGEPPLLMQKRTTTLSHPLPKSLEGLPEEEPVIGHSQVEDLSRLQGRVDEPILEDEIRKLSSPTWPALHPRENTLRPSTVAGTRRSTTLAVWVSYPKSSLRSGAS